MPALVAPAQVVIDLAAGLGWDTAQETGYPLLPGPEIVDTPDKAVFITPVTGPGYVTEEGSADAWGFQARVRGGSDDPLGPGVAAQQFDALILAASATTVDGVSVRAVHRMAGPPTPLPLDPLSRRFEYTCSYIIVTGPPPYVGV